MEGQPRLGSCSQRGAEPLAPRNRASFHARRVRPVCAPLGHRDFGCGYGPVVPFPSACERPCERGPADRAWAARRGDRPGDRMMVLDLAPYSRRWACGCMNSAVCGPRRDFLDGRSAPARGSVRRNARCGSQERCGSVVQPAGIDCNQAMGRPAVAPLPYAAWSRCDLNPAVSSVVKSRANIEREENRASESGPWACACSFE
jgi:hypothetical protein